MPRVARLAAAAYASPMRYRKSLPQLDGSVLLTDGGMETTLIFVNGLDLPCFASFPLLESDEGQAAMEGYFEPYLEVARRHGVGFVLEANTWRANPAWGAQLGYSLDDLAEANRRVVRFVAGSAIERRLPAARSCSARRSAPRATPTTPRAA